MECVALEVQLLERGEGGYGGGQGPGEALVPQVDDGDPARAGVLAGDAVEDADVAGGAPGRGRVGQRIGELEDGALVGRFCGGGGEGGEEEDGEREGMQISPHGGRIGEECGGRRRWW